MKKLKLLVALLSMAMALVFVPASSAQSIPIVAVGSSGFFGAAGLAAITNDPVRGSAPLCGKRFWTGSAQAVDSRSSLTSPALPKEGGTLWVAWDNDAAPTIICAYLSIDSVVGQRVFFGTGASGNGVLLIPSAACTTAGGNKVSFLWDTATTGLPSAVYNALQGTTGTTCPTATSPIHFNVAFTDIRPEDAQFVSNTRTLCTDGNSSPFFPPDDKSCLGYGPGVSTPGTAVVSSYSAKSANNAAYAISGTDPISGLTIPTYQTGPLGEQAVLVFVNATNTAAGGFGDLIANHGLTNVTSHTLSNLYTGQSFFTRDVLGGNTSLGLPGTLVHMLQREPQSGTYTTFEWQAIRQRDYNNANSQETGVLGPSQAGYNGFSGCPFAPSATAYPSVQCSNPLSVTIAGANGLRTRVIGTGEMISVGNTASLPDSLGYAFWSLGNFGNKLNIRYLTVDGTDALFPSYGLHNGVFPGGVASQGSAALLAAPAAGQCGGYFNGDGGATITSFSCNGYQLPTFDGVQSGNYRLWNYVQVVYFGSSAQTPSFSPLNITGFVLSVQDQTAPAPTATLPDIFPTTYCGDATCSAGNQKHPVNVFRSHYAPPVWGIGAPNNGLTSGAENGGDVAGSVVSIQAEKDFFAILSNSFLNLIQ